MNNTTMTLRCSDRAAADLTARMRVRHRITEITGQVRESTDTDHLVEWDDGLLCWTPNGSLI
jgi:hypothetical protein